MLNIRIRMDFETDIFGREIYSLSTLLADLGGFNSILVLIGALICSAGSTRIFNAKLVRQVYLTKAKNHRYIPRDYEQSLPRNNQATSVINFFKYYF